MLVIVSRHLCPSLIISHRESRERSPCLQDRLSFIVLPIFPSIAYRRLRPSSIDHSVAPPSTPFEVSSFYELGACKRASSFMSCTSQLLEPLLVSLSSKPCVRAAHPFQVELISFSRAANPILVLFLHVLDHQSIMRCYVYEWSNRVTYSPVVLSVPSGKGIGRGRRKLANDKK
ncbi:hypothetical protein E5676_scaffold3068G00090 [Cucumis melo var. makuwa]|uniref:Uncharacterized protein n=1 Tax=Cucumis melo var. makuwa TaxID=1194695 RepID=A0A5A7V952_CUCMM|nr:hypothetical protein E6C27_scaffold548G00710 [Cucumis melo var. makuwa]TYK16013.1 hypothetical protein E5676_scaffold3068G00090 [Cucumis melo var. makuwa]